MTALYILDVEEFRPVADVAAAGPRVRVRRIGRYHELSSDGPITVDRRTTGVRHAVWYSAVAAVRDGHVAQYDKDALRVVPR